jgi:hypothetical protein
MSPRVSPTARSRHLGSGARFRASIECLAPVAASVNRHPEVDHLSLGSEMLTPASFPTLLAEKTTAGLREMERPHEGVLTKPGVPAPGPIEASAIDKRPNPERPTCCGVRMCGPRAPRLCC